MTIVIRDLHKIYRMGPESVHALRGINLTINKGEFVAIMGASGSGKSTLMNVLGCLDRPTQGQYILNGKRTDKMDAAALATVRNEEIGFVFQSFELLNRATAVKNVKLPLVYSRRFWRGATARAKDALERVGLKDRMFHRPNQLSGGQRQRVAIARALVNEPSILLADEPTGNLDSKTSHEIIELFRNLHRQGQTIVIVTHEEDIAGNAERIVRLRDGKVWLDSPTRDDPIQHEFLKRMAEAAGSMAAAVGVGGDSGTRMSSAAAAATAEQAKDSVGGSGWEGSKSDAKEGTKPS